MRRQTIGILYGASAARVKPARLAPPPLRIETADSRADDGRRQIEILSDGVMVERSVAGVRMRLKLDLATYRGVAVGVHRDGHGMRVSVSLVHRDRDFDVMLYEASDDENVTAEWLYWSNRFGLPLLIAEHDGSFSQPYQHLGSLTIGEPGPRRKGSILSGRRPRFLSRRKVGRTPAAPFIHREREIIARD